MDIKVKKCKTKKEKMKIDTTSKMDYVRHNFKTVKTKLLHKNSMAECHFEELLRKTPYYYVREKTNFRYNTRWCYYDFFLPFYRIYVEIDGRSHDSKEQKFIDEEKREIVKRKQRFLVRLTNEEVLSMKDISMSYLIHKLCLQEHEHRKNEHIKKAFLPYNYYKNLHKNIIDSITDSIKDTCIKLPEKEEIFMYDKRIGKIYRFGNLYMLRMCLQVRIKDVISRARASEEEQMHNFNYVFGKSQEECILRVKNVLGLEIQYESNMPFSCDRNEIEEICLKKQ